MNREEKYKELLRILVDEYDYDIDECISRGGGCLTCRALKEAQKLLNVKYIEEEYDPVWVRLEELGYKIPERPAYMSLSEAIDFLSEAISILLYRGK
jgi:hypothetical protein